MRELARALQAPPRMPPVRSSDARVRVAPPSMVTMVRLDCAEAEGATMARSVTTLATLAAGAAAAGDATERHSDTLLPTN